MPQIVSSVQLEDRKNYQQQGYVHLRGVLPVSLLEDARVLFEKWVDVLARLWMEQRLIEDLKEDLPFERRFNVLWNDAGRPRHSRSPRSELVFLDPMATFNLLRHPALLDVATALLETDEIVSHGVWNMRPKCPSSRLTDTPLHQDAQYFIPQARTNIMSAWFPLHEVDQHRSCLEVSPAFNRNKLFDGDESSETGFIGISSADSKDLPRVPIAMQPGDLLCFTDLTPHGATPNTTDLMRWSMDMRFVPMDTAHPDAMSRGFVARARDHSKLTAYNDWFAKWRKGQDY